MKPTIPKKIEITQAHWDAAVEEIDSTKRQGTFCGVGSHCVIHQALRPYLNGAECDVQEDEIQLYTAEAPFQRSFPMAKKAMSLIKSFDKRELPPLPMTINLMRRA